MKQFNNLSPSADASRKMAEKLAAAARLSGGSQESAFTLKMAGKSRTVEKTKLKTMAKTKTMATLVMMILIMVLLMVVSCEKRFEGVNLPLAVNSTSLELDSAGATHIMVYSTGQWQVAFDSPTAWAQLNKSSGSGNSDFILTYEGAADTARSAVIVISKDTLVREIAIHQAALSAFQTN